jgi:hypothetical protein
VIEVERSRSGQPYLIVSGRCLSSSFDPQAEAEKWVAHCADRCHDRATLFVLGLGSGYHVQALHQTYPHAQIFVFEAHHEVIAAVAKIHTFTDAIHILPIDREHRFDQNLETRLFQGRHAVLSHSASLQLDQQLYLDLTSFLTGRDPEYAVFYEKINSIYGELQGANRPISIFNIEHAVLEHQLLSSEDRMWLLLRELVK